MSDLGLNWIWIAGIGLDWVGWIGLSSKGLGRLFHGRGEVIKVLIHNRKEVQVSLMRNIGLGTLLETGEGGKTGNDLVLRTEVGRGDP